MYKYIIIFFLFIYCSIGYSQDQFLIDSLLVEYKNANEDTSRINLLTDLSKQYFGNDLIKSLDYIDQALIIAEASENTIKHIKMLRAKGGILTYMGDYDDAINNFLEALKMAEETNVYEEIFPMYINLGAIHSNLNEYDQSMEYYFKALEVYNSLSKKNKLQVNNKLGSLYNNIGSMYLEEKDIKTAESYFKKSLSVGVECKDIKLQIFPLRHIGEIKIERNEFDEALTYLNKAFILAQEIKDKDEIAKSYQSLATYYIITKNYNKALEATKLSKELGIQIGSVKTQQQASKSLYEIHDSLGNFEDAFIAYKEFKLLSDSLINENTIAKITKAKMQYEYDKLEQERFVKKQKTKFATIISISSLVLGLIIIFLLFILSRNHRKRIELERDKLKQKVELKNKELATNVMYLLKKNEFMNSVSTRLLNIKTNLKEENKQPIQKIIFDLQSSIDKEVWEEFEVRFQKVHSAFYQNLQKKFPDLSPTERKLAALLRLDMSSKDIASLTGQSIKSVEVARSRLRKKLGITSQDVNLITFLLEI